jgi:hypothetical protein
MTTMTTTRRRPRDGERRGRIPWLRADRPRAIDRFIDYFGGAGREPHGAFAPGRAALHSRGSTSRARALRRRCA